MGDGKYLLIDVPNFNADTDPTNQLRSYLRLGVAWPTAGQLNDTSNGEDLAGLVQGFVDDTRNRGASSGDAPTPALVEDDSLDLNSPDAQAEATTVLPAATQSSLLDTADRQTQSQAIHTKGGWRDHSDGNRITTTRGDKVEVIQGNYKLVVLGRPQMPTKIQEYSSDGMAARQLILRNAAGFDMSGGLTDMAGDLAFGSEAAPGNLPTSLVGGTQPSSGSGQTIEPTTDTDSPVASPQASDGTSTDPKDDAQARYDMTQSPTTFTGPDGTVSVNVMQQYLWVQNPDDGKFTWQQITQIGAEDVSGSTDQGNMEIVANTWVDSINQQTGSKKKRVDTIVQDTYGVSLEQTNDMTGDISISNTGGSIHYTDSAPNITQIQTSATANNTIITAPLITALQTAAVITEVKSLIHLDVHPGVHADIHVLEHFDVHALFHHEVGNDALHFQWNGTHFESADADVKAVDARVDSIIGTDVKTSPMSVQQIQAQLHQGETAIEMLQQKTSLAGFMTMLVTGLMIMAGPPPPPPPPPVPDVVPIPPNVA